MPCMSCTPRATVYIQHAPSASKEVVSTTYNKTCARLMNIMSLTRRSLATASTISRVIPICPFAPSPVICTCERSPHSLRANAASSTRRLVARAISASVHWTTTCDVALPSEFDVVSIRRSALIASVSNTEGLMLQHERTVRTIKVTRG